MNPSTLIRITGGAALSLAVLVTLLSQEGTQRTHANGTGAFSVVAAGVKHTCALTSGGGTKCWGWNAHGQLGDGTTIDRTTPVDVVGLSSSVAAVAGGANHTCAVAAAGGVKCWGFDFFGKLGNGTLTDSATPVDAMGLTSGVAAIAAGGNHTCALTTAGGVKCWGYNAYGQLGDGSTANRTTPVDATGLTSGVAAIATGGNHSCALTAAGGVKCWGYNTYGQLGDGSTANRTTPVNATGLTSGVVAIAAGGNHTCAVTTAGGVKCWGWNIDGQLGDGTQMSRTAPVDVVGLSGVAAIAAGYQQTCALTSGGGMKCWGSNTEGQLGDGTPTTRTAPVDVVGLGSGVVAIAAGGDHTCAVTTGGSAKCWGDNFYGQLGNGTTTSSSTPVDVVGNLAGFFLKCAADIQQSGKALDAHALCYVDSASIVVNKPAAGAASCPPADPKFCGDGIRGGAPPGCAQAGQSPPVACKALPNNPPSRHDCAGSGTSPDPPIPCDVSQYQYLHVDKAAHLLGVLDNTTNNYELYGCLEDPHGDQAIGALYVELMLVNMSGKGSATIWPNQTNASCVNAANGHSTAGLSGTSSKVTVDVTMETPSTKPVPGLCSGSPCRDSDNSGPCTPSTCLDSDGDGCYDKDELSGTATQGGHRDPLNPFDYPDMPTASNPHKIRIDDVTYVINRYRHDMNTLPVPSPAYDPRADHTIIPGSNPGESWHLGPPNGQIRIDDVTAVINSYRHDCN